MHQARSQFIAIESTTTLAQKPLKMSGFFYISKSIFL